MSLRYNTAGNVPIFKPSKITQIILIEKRKKAKTKDQRKHEQTKTKGSQFHTSAGLFYSVAIFTQARKFTGILIIGFNLELIMTFINR